MSRFPELDAITTAMAEHGNVQIEAFDNRIDPTTTVADTLLYVAIPGAPLQRDDRLSYSHCIHCYRVIGGDDITWLGPAALGSTTTGPFGENTAEDDVIDQTWAEILQRLGISPDPHHRDPQ